MGKQKTPPTSVEVLPNGTKIEFWDSVDAEGNDQQRRYMVNGERFANVTTILDVLSKEALLDWAANLAHEGKNWRAVRAEAGERGTLNHHLLLRLLTGEGGSLADLPEQWRKHGQAGFKFVHRRKPKVRECERMVAHCGHRYAGRLDLLAEIDEKLPLVDFKTVTKWSYVKKDGAETEEKYPPFAENLLQLDLYQGARIECGLQPAECGLIVRLGPDAEVEETWVDLDPDRGFKIVETYRARSEARKVLADAAKGQYTKERLDQEIEEQCQAVGV
ncbi:MAG TPA: hypothetical protein VFX35_01415 [Solirubrobacterales bacterium]|nr:hypothetical protein [Solirubrobacterales bacterium]